MLIYKYDITLNVIFNLTFFMTLVTFEMYFIFWIRMIMMMMMMIIIIIIIIIIITIIIITIFTCTISFQLASVLHKKMIL